jgi:hypothetical protein
VLSDYHKREILDFGGAVNLLEPTDVALPNALTAHNVEFVSGKFKKRFGFAPAININEAATSLFDWIFANGNYIVWFLPGTGVRRSLISSPSSATIMSTSSGNAASFAPAGARLYAAFFNSSGRGAAQGQVYSHNTGADTLFAPPITYTPGAPTQPASGSITAGNHRLGYIIETRNGFLTRPSPSDANLKFQPVTFTATGSKNASWNLNTTWPTYAAKVHVIMTTVANPNRFYFVPGAFASVPGGSPFSVNIGIDVSDDDLVQSQTSKEINKNQLNLLTQSISGTGPFNPSVVLEYGDRMCYLTQATDALGNNYSVVYVSEPSDYQQITADQHVLEAPGRKELMSMFALRNTLYLLGPHGTYATSDSGDVPVFWGVVTVDGSKGTQAPRGAIASPKGDYGWVADEGGLYHFNGTYPDLPISYYQTTDWRRINWAAAWCLQVKDHPSKQQVAVLAPLDGASTPSHLMVWDYTNGVSPIAAKYSIWNIASYSLGAIEVVQNDLASMPTGVAKRLELWVSPSNAAPLLRQMWAEDTNPYRDNGQAITALYETALFPGKGAAGQIFHHWAAHLRVRGSGSLAPIVYTLDAATNKTLRTITLLSSPGKEELVYPDLNREGVYYRFSNSALDEWFEVSAIRHYYEPWVDQR